MKIIPAIDIIDGRCVRLTQGQFEQVTRYPLSPIKQAKLFEDAGIEYLHLVDLDGAKSGSPKNLKVLEAIATSTQLRVDYGGGLRTVENVEHAKNAGAYQVNLGTAILQSASMRELLIQRFGSHFLIAALDVKDGIVKTSGWTSSTNLSLKETINLLLQAGFCNFTVTDISQDGMLSGAAFDLYQQLLQQFPSLNLTASGGVSSVTELERLSSLPLYGAIVGKALYERVISLNDIKNFVACSPNE